MLAVQNKTNPSSILDAISSGVPRPTQSLFVASAYVTAEGLALLMDRIQRAVGPRSFVKMPKKLVTTFDFGLTDPDALDTLMKLGVDVHVANSNAIARGNLAPAVAYHPKVYAFETGAGDWVAFSGSANLTARGMTINTETVVDTNLTAIEMKTVMNDLSYGAGPLTPKMLADYRALRVARPPSGPITVEITPVPAPTPSPKAVVFGDAVASGALKPSGFARFWVQTLLMSGGSGSQLELPRGANSFFGFNFNAHVPGPKVTIGKLVLSSGAHRWMDRILSWHGRNGMERVNMPTAAKGGYVYDQAAVCFRRIGGGYEFFVAPWNSNLARSWRIASAATGHLYALGKGSPRVCGLL